MIQTLRAVFDATGRLRSWRRPAEAGETPDPAGRCSVTTQGGVRQAPRGDVPRRRHRPGQPAPRVRGCNANTREACCSVREYHE